MNACPLLLKKDFLLLVTGICITLTGCNKLLDAGLPQNEVLSVLVYNNDSLVLSTDYVANAGMARTAVAKVYDQLVLDLQEAQQKLPVAYATTAAYPTARVRANQLAATALLARVYLYREQWANAEGAATS